jgi:hypothetical protein
MYLAAWRIIWCVILFVALLFGYFLDWKAAAFVFALLGIATFGFIAEKRGWWHNEL